MDQQTIDEATLDQLQREWECGDVNGVVALTWVEFKNRALRDLAAAS